MLSLANYHDIGSLLIIGIFDEFIVYQLNIHLLEFAIHIQANRTNRRNQ